MVGSATAAVGLCPRRDGDQPGLSRRNCRRRRTHYAFCCPHCAAIWLGRRPAAAAAVTVTDEVSGEPVDAAAAWFVRSSVVTVPTTGNRIHAFRDRADAERHAERFLGTVLPASETPFGLAPVRDPEGSARP